MTKFIFALESNSAEEIEDLGAPEFNIVVSTDAYFKENDCVQDDYEPDDYDALMDVMGRNNLFELTESVFESETESLSRADITDKLNSEPLFSYSQAFQDFIDDNPDKD